jgi:hypothetical protein
MRKMRLFQKDTYVTVDFLEKTAEVFKLEQEKISDGMLVGEIGVGQNKRQIHYYRPEAPVELGLEVELTAFLQTIRGEKVEAATGVEGRNALDVALQVLSQMEVTN